MLGSSYFEVASLCFMTVCKGNDNLGLDKNERKLILTRPVCSIWLGSYEMDNICWFLGPSLEWIYCVVPTK